MKELAELVGIIIGDGNICYISKIRKYYVEITGNPKNEHEFYKHISGLFMKVMGKPGIIFTRQRGLHIRVNNKKFVEYLINDLGMCYGKYKFARITIPEKIILEGKEATYLCLRGIFDTDGTFFTSKKDGKIYPSIEIVTCSRKLAIQIYEILIKDFRVRMRWKDCEDYTFKRCYVVSLYGLEQVCLWFDLIGSSNPAKRLKYESFIKNLK